MEREVGLDKLATACASDGIQVEVGRPGLGVRADLERFAVALERFLPEDPAAGRRRLTLPEFEAGLVNWITNSYHTVVQPALGMSPIEAFMLHDGQCFLRVAPQGGLPSLLRLAVEGAGLRVKKARLPRVSLG